MSEALDIIVLDAGSDQHAVALARSGADCAMGKKASRPFEAAVASVTSSIFLASINPKLDFHEQTRGCLFDYNKKRSTIVRSLVDPRFEPECMTLVSPRYREAAASMVRALREYQRTASQ